MTLTSDIGNKCPYCENYHTGICPLISSIEYYENGAVKEVKFHQIDKYILDSEGNIKLQNPNQ